MRFEWTMEEKAFHFTRDVFEMAPHVCVMLFANVHRTTILYANYAINTILRLQPEEILDQSTTRSTVYWCQSNPSKKADTLSDRAAQAFSSNTRPLQVCVNITRTDVEIMVNNRTSGGLGASNRRGIVSIVNVGAKF